MSSSENTICAKKLRWYPVKRKRRPCQNGAMVIGFPTLVSLSPSRLPGSDPTSYRKRTGAFFARLVFNHRKTFGIVIDRVLTINWCAVDRGKRHWILTNGKTPATSNITWQEILEGTKISKRRIFVLIIGCLSNKEARHHFPKFDRQSNARRRRSKKRRGTSKARRSHWSLCQSLLKKCCLFIWNLK